MGELAQGPLPTCPLCEQMDELYPFTEDKKRRKKIALKGKALVKQTNILSAHPKCNVCKLLLGGTHTGGLENKQGLCVYCSERNERRKLL